MDSLCSKNRKKSFLLASQKYNSLLATNKKKNLMLQHLINLLIITVTYMLFFRFYLVSFCVFFLLSFLCSDFVPSKRDSWFSNSFTHYCCPSLINGLFSCRKVFLSLDKKCVCFCVFHYTFWYKISASKFVYFPHRKMIFFHTKYLVKWKKEKLKIRS